MQAIFLAPVLSATSRMVPIWIMASSHLGPLDDLAHPPPLGRRHRPAGNDDHFVADLALVGLVMRVEARRAPQVALVEAVHDGALDRHDHGLVHLVADHPAREGLAPRAFRVLAHGSLASPTRSSRAEPSAPAPARGAPGAPSPATRAGPWTCSGAGRRAAGPDPSPSPAAPRPCGP